ncbi:MAG: Hsp33 family molecular chaperone [Pseudomonadota bacterium]
MLAADAVFEDDMILPFQVGETAIRGRVVRLGGAIDEILSRHPFPDPVREILGEAAVLVAMMGSSLKFDGRMIFQARGDGPVSMMVADYEADGSLRATASVAHAIGAASRFDALVGSGHFAVTVDQGVDMERYQGVAPIEGETLAEAAVAYFNQSEQIPTAIRLAVGRISRPGEGERWRAGGVIAQFVPGEGGDRERGEAVIKGLDDEEAWARAAAFLETAQPDELLDPALSPHQMLYRLFHEDGVRVFDPSKVTARCSCNSDRIQSVLVRYSPEELVDMVEDGAIRVTCEFCRKLYKFNTDGSLQA